MLSVTNATRISYGRCFNCLVIHAVAPRELTVDERALLTESLREERLGAVLVEGELDGDYILFRCPNCGHWQNQATASVPAVGPAAPRKPELPFARPLDELGEPDAESP